MWNQVGGDRREFFGGVALAATPWLLSAGVAAPPAGEKPMIPPLIVREKDNQYHYLGEDWAFSHRLTAIGVRPMADTSIRLYHYGPYGYSWEDVGSERARFQSYNFSFGG